MGKFLLVWEVWNRLKVRLRTCFVGAEVKERKRAGIVDSRPLLFGYSGFSDIVIGAMDGIGTVSEVTTVSL